MSSKPIVLIVEDEPGIADTLQYALRTDGFEPLWCATGSSAGARAGADLTQLASVHSSHCGTFQRLSLLLRTF